MNSKTKRSTATNTQIINRQQEKLPSHIPHEVVSLMVEKEWTITRAWRKHLGLTQVEVARRLGVSQGAYSLQERNKKNRRSTLEKIAQAFGIQPEQLDV